ncbi:carbamate kinase [bacterium]|nr:carbamate kinase [bacterium]
MVSQNRVAVVAVGGNSLIKDKQHQSVPDQYQAVCETVKHVVNMIEQGWEVVLTHGNGPQVGFILLRSEAALNSIHSVPVDSAVADTQGAIGYQFQMALHNEFLKRGMQKLAATVVTQVVVDPKDPAFLNPTKPIGPFMDEAQAQERSIKDGWDVMEDAGRGWRRVVASPKPQKIVELEAVRTLVHSGNVVIAVGGGGVPVVEDNGVYLGIAAVIDKDYASGLLAANLHADSFIISTAVEKVYINFGKPEQKALDRVTISEAKKYMAEGHFAKGSMAPKVEAAIRFLEMGGSEAIITNPENLSKAVRGEAGTHFVHD